MNTDNLKIEEQPKTFLQLLNELQPGQSLKWDEMVFVKVTETLFVVQHGSAMTNINIGGIGQPADSVDTKVAQQLSDLMKLYKGAESRLDMLHQQLSDLNIPLREIDNLKDSIAELQKRQTSLEKREVVKTRSANATGRKSTAKKSAK